MQTHRWEKVYSNRAFAVTTAEPSSIVRKYAGLIPRGSKVADLGCGHGRNSLYLAGIDHLVDAYDVADLQWYDNESSIRFQKRAVEDIVLEKNAYGAILTMMRLIQYLPFAEVERLIEMAADSLMPGGMLLLNYGVSGGAINAGVLDVDTYSHEIETVARLFDRNGITIIHSTDEVMPQQNVTINNCLIHACDLVGQKAIQNASLGLRDLEPHKAGLLL